MADLALGVDVNFDGFQPEFGDEWVDGLVAAAVFGYREHCDPFAEPRLYSLERGHLAQARLAPRGPEIDDDGLAAQIREFDCLAGAVGERNCRRRERL